MISSLDIAVVIPPEQRIECLRLADEYEFGVVLPWLVQADVLADPEEMDRRIATMRETAGTPRSFTACNAVGPDWRPVSADPEIVAVVQSRIRKLLAAARHCAIGCLEVATAWNPGFEPVDPSTFAARFSQFWIPLLEECSGVRVVFVNARETSADHFGSLISGLPTESTAVSLDLESWNHHAHDSLIRWDTAFGNRIHSIRLPRLSSGSGTTGTGSLDPASWQGLIEEIAMIFPGRRVILEAANRDGYEDLLAFLSQFGAITYAFGGAESGG